MKGPKRPLVVYALISLTLCFVVSILAYWLIEWRHQAVFEDETKRLSRRVHAEWKPTLFGEAITIEDATLSRDIEDLIRRADYGTPRGNGLWLMAMLHDTYDNREDALRVYRQLAGEHPRTHGTFAYEGISTVLRKMGNLEGAAAAVEQSVKSSHSRTCLAPDGYDDNGPRGYENLSRYTLGNLQMRLGRWAEALENLERYTPVSDCGNHVHLLEIARQMAIAQCRFELGRHAEALSGLWSQVASDPNKWCCSRRGNHTEAGALYVVLAARNNDLDEARRRLTYLREIDATAPDFRAARFERSIHIAEGWLAKDAARVYEFVMDLTRDQHLIAGYHSDCPELDSAAWYLTHMGDPGLELLTRKISGGDLKAGVIAAITHRSEFLAEMEARWRAESDKERKKSWAISIEHLKER